MSALVKCFTLTRMDAEAARQKASTLGKKRTRALTHAEEAMRQIRDLAPQALAVGMTKREYAALTGISRPTLDAILDQQT